MDKKPLLERRDGVNSSRPPELGKNDVCECHSVWAVQRGHDSYSRIQHEESDERQRNNKALGYRRPTAFQEHVGAVLSRSQLYRVRHPYL
jgi:hypothetical protein